MTVRSCVRSFARGMLALLFTAYLSGAQAVVLDRNEHDGFVEYLGVTGLFSGRNAPFRMLVPEDWNGELLVYARGTGSAIKLTELNGELVPILDPDSGLPIIGVAPLTNTLGAPRGDNTQGDALEQVLLGHGYAMIASDYQPDPRLLDEGLLTWTVEDGVRDTLAVTLQARRLLRFTRGRVQRTLLWGRSQGSLVTIRLMENLPWLYNGSITGCTVGAGTPRTWDTALGVALAYDIAFAHEGGWNEAAWGSIGGGDIPTTLRFTTDVLPVLAAQLANPANFRRFEFVRVMNGLPLEGFYPPPFPGSVNPDFNWLAGAFLFLTEVRADLESLAKAAGRVSQNLNHTYVLTDANRAYLGSLGFDVDALLAAMNARRTIAADEQARAYTERHYAPSGRLHRPLLSMHTTRDGVAIPGHESALADTVAAAGKSALLRQVFTDAVGHCAFSIDQWLTTVQAMESWLDTGERPDDGFFPATAGFDLDFVPRPWPQP